MRNSQSSIADELRWAKKLQGATLRKKTGRRNSRKEDRKTDLINLSILNQGEKNYEENRLRYSLRYRRTLSERAKGDGVSENTGLGTTK